MFKNFFFDYFYYRLFQLNSNKGEYQGFPAVAVISLVQVEFIAGIVMIAVRIFYDRTDTAPHSKVFTNIGVAISIALMIFNYQKYMKRYNEIAELWKDETASDRVKKGYLIVLVIILSFAPLYIIGSYL